MRRDAARKVAISIHAPVKGATFIAITFNYYCFNFNPRTREGCDNWDRIPLIPFKAFQSTHP